MPKQWIEWALFLTLWVPGHAAVPTGTLPKAEFIIEKERKNQLPPLPRLFEKAPVAKKTTTGQTIPALVQEHQQPFALLQPQMVIFRSLPTFRQTLYGNYLKAGCSTHLWPYLEGCWATTYQDRYAYGLYVRHLASKNTQRTRTYHTDIQAHGKLFTTPMVYEGMLHYTHDTSPPPITTQPTLTSKSLHQIQAVAHASKAVIGPLQYQLTLGCHSLSAQAGQEKQATLQAQIDYALNDMLALQGTTSLAVLQRHQEHQTTHHRLVHVQPMLALAYPPFQGQFGFSIIAHTASTSVIVPPHVHPILSVSYMAYPSLCPYIGVGGAFQQNSLLHVLAEHAKLVPTVTLLPTNQPWIVYGGARGNLVGGVTYHTGVRVSKIQNLYCFVDDKTYPGYFDMQYDPGATVCNGFGEMTYASPADQWTIRLRGDYFHYSLQQLKKPWYLPSYQWELLHTYRLHDKVLFKNTLYGLGGLVGPTAVPQAAIIDLSLALDYVWNQRFSIFFQLDNVLARKNERYLYYTLHPFQCTGGVTYVW